MRSLDDSVRNRLPYIATLLTPDERLRVDAAGLGLYAAWHRQSVDEVAGDVRAHRVTAVVLSVSCCEPETIPRIARMVREFPRVPAVAVVSQYNSRSAQALLLLGRCGVRTLVDIRDAGGWRELRSLLSSDRSSDLRRIAQAQLTIDLAGAPAGCLHFFHVLFDVAPYYYSASLCRRSWHPAKYVDEQVLAVQTPGSEALLGSCTFGICSEPV